MKGDRIRDIFESVGSLLDNCDVDIQHKTDVQRSEVSDAQSLAEYGAQFEGSEVGSDPY